MSYPPPRSLPTHHKLRGPSINPNAASSASTTTRPSTTSTTTGASPALQARIAEKKLELANLQELRDLSAQLAAQMAQLEAKLGTLASGTEAVAVVLSNWHNVLRAISMASMKVPVPRDGEGEVVQETGAGAGVPLPQTLVRILVQEDMRASAGAGEAVGE